MNSYFKKSISLLLLAILIFAMVPFHAAEASSSSHVTISVSPSQLADAGTATVTIKLTNTNSASVTPTQPPSTTPETTATPAPSAEATATPAPTAQATATPAPTPEATPEETEAPNPTKVPGGDSADPAPEAKPEGVTVRTGYSTRAAGDYTDITISNSYGASFNTSGVVIPAGSSKTFTATMQVSTGMIGVNLPFTVTWKDNGVTKSETVNCKISRITASPYLNFIRTASPVSASEGTDVTVTYNFVNNGSVKLTNITLVDRQVSGSSSAMLPPFSLDPGQSKEFNYMFRMGKTTVVSDPVVTFYAQGSSTQLTKTVSKLAIGLIQSQLTKEVIKGDPTPEGVKFTIYLTNNGNQKLNSLVVTDELDNKISDKSFSLAVGESKVLEYFVPNPEAVRYVVFKIEGFDYNNTVFKDNTASYAVRPYIDTSLLGLSFTAATTSSLSPENMIGIEFNVQNTGSLPLNSLSISEKNLDYEIYSWNELAVGESQKALADINIGSQRDLVFILTYEDSSGNKYTHEAYVTADSIDIDSMVPEQDPSGNQNVSVLDGPGIGKQLDTLITSTGEKLMKWFKVLGIIAAGAAVIMLGLGIAEIVARRNRRSEIE
ncbi:MAG: hypothetical protein J6P98_02305 [Clostridia bacterium]|nr:hypothetical protein [Clostridia bacterium]